MYWLLATYIGLHAQDLKFVSFEKTEHDFGQLDANEQSFADFTFKFLNQTNQPVQVVSARGAASHVAASGTRGQVPPNKFGSVLVTCDLRRLSGSFREQVFVEIGKFNTQTGEINTKETQQVALTLSGSVKSRTKGPADFYPHKQGNLWFSRQLISMGQTNDRDRFVDSITVYNAGLKNILVSEISAGRGFSLEGITRMSEIKAKDSVRLRIVMQGNMVGDYDWINQQIVLKTNDDTLPDKIIRLHTTLMPAFPKMSREDSARAPQIVFEKQAHQFGSLTSDKPVTVEFKFKNLGKSELKLLKIQPSCSCISATSDRMHFKPDEKGSIKVTFMPENRKGLVVKQIRLITNDPSRPLVQLTVQAQLGPLEAQPDPSGD
jgi:hypothetical protein